MHTNHVRTLWVTCLLQLFATVISAQITVTIDNLYGECLPIAWEEPPDSSGCGFFHFGEGLVGRSMVPMVDKPLSYGLDETDVQVLQDMILGLRAADSYQWVAADMNGDQKVNVLDVNWLWWVVFHHDYSLYQDPWIFIEADRVHGSYHQAIHRWSKKQILFTDTPHYVAIKRGDVTQAGPRFTPEPADTPCEGGITLELTPLLDGSGEASGRLWAAETLQSGRSAGGNTKIIAFKVDDGQIPVGEQDGQFFAVFSCADVGRHWLQTTYLTEDGGLDSCRLPLTVLAHLVDELCDDDRPHVRALPALTFYSYDQAFEAGQDISVPIYVDNFAKILGFQWQLKWQDLRLERVQLSTDIPLETSDYHRLDERHLRVAWHEQELNPLTVPKGTPLMTLHFHSLDAGDLRERIFLSNDFEPFEFAEAVAAPWQVLPVEYMIIDKNCDDLAHRIDQMPIENELGETIGVYLTAQPRHVLQDFSYVWQMNDGRVVTDQGISDYLAVDRNQIIRLEILGPRECMATLWITVDQISSPSCGVSIQQDARTGALTASTLTFNGEPGAGATFQWSTQDTMPVIYPTQPGQHCVTTRLPNGCEAESCYEVTRLVHDPDGVPQDAWTAYPNPARDYLRLDSPDEVDYPLPYEICDLLGRSVRRGQLMGPEKQGIEIDQLPPGVYFLSLHGPPHTSAITFIKY